MNEDKKQFFGLLLLADESESFFLLLLCCCLSIKYLIKGRCINEIKRQQRQVRISADRS